MTTAGTYFDFAGRIQPIQQRHTDVYNNHIWSEAHGFRYHRTTIHDDPDYGARLFQIGPRLLSAWIVAWRSSLCRKMNSANSNKATPLLHGDVERNLRVITIKPHDNETLWLFRYR